MPLIRRYSANSIPRAAGHDELITITLEDSSTNFAVSKALLCKTSDYFKKALDGGFREAGTRQLRLPGCDKHTFNMFLYYLLKRELPDESISKMNDDGADLGRLWAFGGKSSVICYVIAR